MSIIHNALKKVESEKSAGIVHGPASNIPSPPSAVTDAGQPSAEHRLLNVGRSWRLPGLSLKKNLIGIDIGSSSIKFVKLRGSGKVYQLASAGYVRLPAEAGEKDVIMALRELVREQGIVNEKVSSSIAAKSLTFGNIVMPKMPDADLEEAVKWEVKKGIDFPDNAVIDYIVNDEVFEEGKKRLSIMTFAVRKEEVLEHVNILKESSLVPDAVDVGPMALLSAFDYNYGWEKNKRYAIIDMGASKTTLSIVSNGSLRFTRYIPLAGNDITRNIQDEEQIDFEAAEGEKVRYAPVIDDAPQSVQNAVGSFIEGISMEIRRSLTYYQAHQREGGVDEVLLSGGCTKIKGLRERIKNSVGLPTVIYDIMKRLSVKGESASIAGISPMLVEALGLALRREGE